MVGLDTGEKSWMGIIPVMKIAFAIDTCRGFVLDNYQRRTREGEGSEEKKKDTQSVLLEQELSTVPFLGSVAQMLSMHELLWIQLYIYKMK